MRSIDPDYVPALSKEDISEAVAQALDFLEYNRAYRAEQVLLELYEKLEEC